MIPTLIKQISGMQAEINILKQTNNTDQNLGVVEKEELIYEMLDRQNRKANIIIYNVKEPDLNTQSERSSQDNETVKNILENFDIGRNNWKVFRLGKFVANKARPIKVILNSPEDAINVLKNKQLIKIPSVKIFSDQTVAQRQYFQKVKSELQELIAKGDNSKTIKYINNKPTIVNRMVNYNSKK